MSNIIDISRYSFSKNDRLFLDTYIWLYIEGPNAGKGNVARIYGNALKDMIRTGAQIGIDVLVLSEFVNRYVRKEYNQLKRKTEEFKDFRKSDNFPPVAEEIVYRVKRIMKRCERFESGFNQIDIENLLADFQHAYRDFNDEVFVRLCKREHLTFVTHDGDFANTTIPVLTANSSLLGCP